MSVLFVVFDILEEFFSLIYGSSVAVVVEVVRIVAFKKGADNVVSVRSYPLAEVHTGLVLDRHRLCYRAVFVDYRTADAPYELLSGESVQTHVSFD